MESWFGVGSGARLLLTGSVLGSSLELTSVYSFVKKGIITVLVSEVPVRIK
jgi:hypothetical protein